MTTLFDVTLNVENDQDAVEWAKGFVFMECETYERALPKYSREVTQLGDVVVHYDFGAYYYFFEEISI